MDYSPMETLSHTYSSDSAPEQEQDSDPIYETDVDMYSYNNSATTSTSISTSKIIAIIALRLILSVIAVYICLGCSATSNIFMQIIYALLAFIVPEVYIVYYAIYRVLLGNKCPR